MSNTTRNKPKSIQNKVLYWHNGRVVRMVQQGPNICNVRHHAEHIVADTSDVLAATKAECIAYLQPAK